MEKSRYGYGYRLTPTGASFPQSEVFDLWTKAVKQLLPEGQDFVVSKIQVQSE
jgi:hypothetical protein